MKLMRSLALILCALAAFLSSASSLGNGFAYDDGVIIGENPRVTDPAEASRIWTEPYWGSAAGGLFRPLTLWTYSLNHRLHGLKPLGFHLVNVLLHVAVSVLVMLAALQGLAYPAAFVAGLLFAVHPVHTEAVANVVGRAELLAALCFLAGWLLHSPPQGRTASGVLSGAGRRPLLVAVFFFLAVLAKENALAFPAALFFRDVVRRRGFDRRTYVFLGVAVAAYIAWRYVVLGGIANPPGFRIQRIDNLIATLPTLAGRWTALSVIGRYAVLLAFPWRLSADYSWPLITVAGAGSLWAWLGLAVILSLAAVLVRELIMAFRGDPPGPPERQEAAVGLAILAFTLVPVSNLLFPIGTIMAERLLYLPSAGFVIAIAAGGQWLASRRPALRPVLVTLVGLAVLLGGWKSFTRSREWKDSATLFSSTIRTFPESARAHHYYGVSLYVSGRVDEGLEQMSQAVRIDPTYVDAWINMGSYKLEQHRLTEARADLLRAIEIDSTASTAFVNLCAIEFVDGRPAEAERYGEKAVSLSPNSVDAWFNLGLARTALADTAGLITAFRKAIELKTKDPDAYDTLAWYLAVSGGPLDEALRAAAKAVELRPNARSYDTLGEVNFRARRWADARSAWTRALSLGVENPEEIQRRLAAIQGW